MDRPPTSADVARVAGVSRTTVSNVLNNTPDARIGEATRRRVIAAAKQLGHVPHASARTLRSGRSRVILALMPDWDMGPTFASGLEALNRVFADRGYVLVVHSRSEASRPLAELWREFRPAMVMSFCALGRADTALLARSGIPFLQDTMNEFLSGITRMQAEFLVSLGNRRLCFLSPAQFVPEEIRSARASALVKYCAENGLPVPVVLELAYAAAAVDALLDSPEFAHGAVGVAAHTDELAAFLHRAALDAGIAFDVVGVGNRPIAELGLTTVAFDFDRVARFWARPVLARLGGEQIPVEDGFPGWIVERGSTTPRSRD
ncbi:LacI family DNA-binding transcriptional regulator [Glaciibacter sp. 2TAF33]|uniref:LacI family DNA-binding transcriptional regulator n=1 Tax=Glaciibacter sp. 2TAF33 TaxID=3233015 RepID=UPI003F936E7D